MKAAAKKAIFISAYIVFILLCLEICARSYYALGIHLDFFTSTNDFIYYWYPELKKAKNYKYDAGCLNTLLLGGSVLTKEWGSVQQHLEEGSVPTLGKPLNILNLAASAHGTLDSYYKYIWLSSMRFDTVILYHGINETRANNVPKELFRKDYSHYAWYEEINFYFNHPLIRKTLFCCLILASI